MKRLSTVLVIAALGLSSCDKVSDFVAKNVPRSKKDAEAPAAGAPASHPMLEALKEKVDANRGNPASPPVVRNLGTADYEAFIASPGKLVVVDYHADWCGPCKMLSPVLEQLAAEAGGTVIIGKVDVDGNPSLAEKAGVRSIPDVRLFRDGVQVDRFIGIEKAGKIRALFAKHSAGLDAVESKTPDVQSSAPSSKGASATFQPMDKNWMPPGIKKR